MFPLDSPRWVIHTDYPDWPSRDCHAHLRFDGRGPHMYQERYCFAHPRARRTAPPLDTIAVCMRHDLRRNIAPHARRRGHEIIFHSDWSKLVRSVADIINLCRKASFRFEVMAVPMQVIHTDCPGRPSHDCHAHLRSDGRGRHMDEERNLLAHPRARRTAPPRDTTAVCREHDLRRDVALHARHQFQSISDVLPSASKCISQ